MEAIEIAKIIKYNDDKLQEYFDSEKLDVLHKIKIYVDDLYYNTGKSSGLDDWQYDMLKDTLIRRDPHYIVPIGVRIRQHENRVQLPFWLGSMEKISVQSNAKNAFWDHHKKKVENEIAVKLGISVNLSDEIVWKNVSNTLRDKFTKEFEKHMNALWNAIKDDKSELNKWKSISNNKYELEIAKWISTNKAFEYILEHKLDGVSCLMVMNNGKIKLYTRGDGIIGADISYLAQYFKTIPKDLKETINVRGELIIKKSIFNKKYSKDYANPRNMVAGCIGAKTVRKGLSDIEFVAYEIVGNDIMQKPSEQLNYLDNLGFVTVYRETIEEITVDTLIGTLIRFKETSLYDIDGIIVQPNTPYERNTKGNPSYAFAFKMRLEGNSIDVTVKEVEWQVSKWGRLKPRVWFAKTPLGGVNIEKATAHNAKYVVYNSLGPGAVIRVTRSGDVIPYILKTLKKASAPEMPDIPYKWNKTNVDIYTEDNPDMMCIKLITGFFEKIGIKQIGEKRVEKIYNAGYDSLLKIISASKSDLMEVPNLGSRVAEVIYINIHKGLQDVTISNVLGASGVFEFGMGKKRITSLFNDFPDILDKYKIMSKNELINRILRIEGFADKTAQQIVDNIKWADQFIQAINHFATFKQKVVGDSMKDIKVVLTGGRDKKLEEEIMLRGGKILSCVSKNVNVVIIAGSKPGKKLQKAYDLGIEILNKEQFIAKYIK